MPTRDPPAPKPRLIDPQRRVILPAEVLEALGVDSGDYVGFRLEGDGVRVYRVEFLYKGKAAPAPPGPKGK